MDPGNSYHLWASLRDMYYKLLDSIGNSDAQAATQFNLLLLISHYFAMRSATFPHKNLEELSTKITGIFLIKEYVSKNKYNEKTDNNGV